MGDEGKPIRLIGKREIFALLAPLFLFGFAGIASAHEFGADGTIGVILHTEPLDDPVAGAGSSLLFAVSDHTGRFRAEDCDCSVAITEDDERLFRAPLQLVGGEGSLYNFQSAFIFPDIADYHVEISGSPKSGGTFQSFRVGYDLEVRRGVSAENPSEVPPSFLDYALLAGSMVISTLCFSVPTIAYVRRKGSVKK